LPVIFEDEHENEGHGNFATCSSNGD